MVSSTRINVLVCIVLYLLNLMKVTKTLWNSSPNCTQKCMKSLLPLSDTVNVAAWFTPLLAANTLSTSFLSVVALACTSAYGSSVNYPIYQTIRHKSAEHENPRGMFRAMTCTFIAIRRRETLHSPPEPSCWSNLVRSNLNTATRACVCVCVFPIPNSHQPKFINGAKH